MSHRKRNHPSFKTSSRRIFLEQLESRAMLAGIPGVNLIPNADTPTGSISEGQNVPVRVSVLDPSHLVAEVLFSLDADFEDDDNISVLVDHTGTHTHPADLLNPGYYLVTAAGFNWNQLVLAGLDTATLYVKALDATATNSNEDDSSIGIDEVHPTLALEASGDCGGTSVTLTVTVSDPNPNDDFDIFVNWGDGTGDPLSSLPDTFYHQILQTAGADPFEEYVLNIPYEYAEPGSYTITVTTSNNQFEINELDPLSYTRDDVTPAGGSLGAEIQGPLTTSVPGQSREFTANVTQGCGAPGTPTYNWSVTKDDIHFADSTNAAFVFLPDDAGDYEVSLSVTVDGDTVAADPVSFDVDEFVFDIESGHLAIGSGMGSDTVVLSFGSVIVTINGVPICDHDATSVTVYGGAGDDTITVDSAITVPLIIYGGAGNDVIKGGSGKDVIYGGEGTDHLKGGDGADILIGDVGMDVLTGGSGRDILIGGDGADKIHGNAEDDIIISGMVSFSDNLDALLDIRTIWLSEDCFIIRTAKIEGCLPSTLELHLNSTTVSDDNDKDILAGDQGIDWFFANLCLDSGDDANQKDKILDANLFELCFANDLDF